MNARVLLYTPHTRGQIMRLLYSPDRGFWKGRRHGVTATLRLNQNREDPRRVLWTARPALPSSGRETDVYQALSAIETAAAAARLETANKERTPQC